MTAYDAARWYMLCVGWCFLALLVTLASDQPTRWLELGAAYLVTWPLIGTWRDV